MVIPFGCLVTDRQLRRRRARRDSETGFSLIELLVVIAIMGIVTGALATAIVVSGRTSTATAQRYDESHDVQLAASYLAADVQSAVEVSASHWCYPDSLAQLASFRYDLGSSMASYYYGPPADDPGGQPRLVRRFCDDDGNLVADTPLVHYAGGAPVLTCPSAGDASVACNLATDSHPKRVRIAISEKGGFQYALSGTRRAYASGQPPSAAAFPPLLALGSGNTQLSISNNAQLIVNGTAIVNSNSPSAITVANNAQFDYTQMQVFTGGGAQVGNNGQCGGGSSCTTTTRDTRVPDPLAGLPEPDTSTMVNRGSATGGGTFLPGVYTSMTFSNNAQVTLEPGIYVVNGGFCPANNTEITGFGVFLFVKGTAGCGSNAIDVRNNVELTLSPMTTGDYKGITIWSKPDAGVNLAGNNSSAQSVDGLLYVPNITAPRTVTLGDNNATLIIGAVIAPNLTISNNARVTVGSSD